MKRKKRLLSNNLYYCMHISSKDDVLDQIDGFSINRPEGQGLVRYLKEDAVEDENVGNRRVYLVRDKKTNELAGYFCLKAGLVSCNEMIEIINGERRKRFDVIPGIELSEFAMNDRYLEKHEARRHTGIVIFNDFILPIVRQASLLVGVKILYAFSVDKEGSLLSRYINDYKFRRLSPEEEEKIHERLRPRWDDDCIFIYQRIATIPE